MTQATPETTVSTPEAPPRACPAFNPRHFRRQLQLDALARWIVALAIIAFVIFSQAAMALSMWASILLAAAVLVLWMRLTTVSARAWLNLRELTPLLEEQPQEGESRLAENLRLWPLHRPVRLLLYHRLAMVRHRQSRFGETSAICATLLSQRMGTAERVRPHLLLLMIESRLIENDLWGAYLGLVQLHRMPQTLVESLQHLAMQTRYEIAAGYHHLTLERIAHKLAMVELMPAPQCGAMHVLFAVAAEHRGQRDLASWLHQRAQLLCEPEQYQALLNGESFLRVPGLVTATGGI